MKKLLFVFIVTMFLLPYSIKADDASFGLKCYTEDSKLATTLKLDDTITCNLTVGSLDSNITKVTGEIAFNNTLELVEFIDNDNWTLSQDNKTFTYTSSSNITNNIDLKIAKLKVVSTISGSMQVNLKNIKLDDNLSKEKISYLMETYTCVNGLSSLEVEGYSLSPSFNTNTTTYTVKVDTNSIKINAKKLCDTSSLSGVGEKKLDVGKNTLKVITTLGDDKKEYTINVTYEPKKSSVKTLDKLEIEEAKIKFDKNTLEYDIELEEKVDKLNITYKTTDNNASVEIKGNENLKEGKNIIKLVVTAEDDSTLEYIINVELPEVDGSLLKNLIIKDDKDKEIKLAPTFKEKTKNYTIIVPKSLDEITIDAECQDDKCLITGDGKISIKDKSQIEIKVTHEENETTYKINIKRETEESNKSKVWLIILIILLLIAIGIAIFFIIKKKNNSKKVKPVAKSDNLDLTKEISIEDIIIRDSDSIIKDNLEEPKE